MKIDEYLKNSKTLNVLVIFYFKFLVKALELDLCRFESHWFEPTLDPILLQVRTFQNLTEINFVFP